MRKLIAIILVFFGTTLNAQEIKHLNIEDAVLGYYKGLYPEQKSLQWMEGTDDYIVIENNVNDIETVVEEIMSLIKKVNYDKNKNHKN